MLNKISDSDSDDITLRTVAFESICRLTPGFTNISNEDQFI